MSGRSPLFSRLRRSVRPLFKITSTNHENIFGRSGQVSSKLEAGAKNATMYNSMYDMVRTSKLAGIFNEFQGPRMTSRFKRLRSQWYKVRKTRSNSFLFASNSKDLLPSNFLSDANDDAIAERWRNFTKKNLMPLGNVSVKNEIEIYHRGDEYYEHLWQDISQAQHQILMEIYIMEPDAVAQRTLSELTQASERGVSVTLIVDGLGSSKMDSSHFNELRRAGGIVLCYNEVSVSRFFDVLLLKHKIPWIFGYRNHKKICVIDDAVAYTGGMNMTGEYCSNSIPGGINKFRDTHCRLEGAVIKFLKESIYYSVLDIDPKIPNNLHDATAATTSTSASFGSGMAWNQGLGTQGIGDGVGAVGAVGARDAAVALDDSDSEFERVLTEGELTDEDSDYESGQNMELGTDGKKDGNIEKNLLNSKNENSGKEREFPTQILPAFLQPFQKYSIQNHWKNAVNAARSSAGMDGNGSHYQNFRERSRRMYKNRIRVLASTPRVTVQEWLHLDKKRKSQAQANENGADSAYAAYAADGVDSDDTGESMDSVQPWDKGYKLPLGRSGLMTSDGFDTSQLEASQLSKLINEAKSVKSLNYSLSDLTRLKSIITQTKEAENHITESNEKKDAYPVRHSGEPILSSVLGSSASAASAASAGSSGSSASLRKDNEKSGASGKGVPLGQFLGQYGKNAFGESDASGNSGNESLSGNSEESSEIEALRANTEFFRNYSVVAQTNNCYIQVLESYRDKRMRFIQKALRDSIDNAVSHVFIANPYFLPPRFLRKSLINAAKRGVDVRIITCNECDVWAVAQASRHLYNQFLIHDNIRMFEYSQRVLHAKMVLIDDVFVSLGSFNWDDWSHKRNLEVNLMLMDSKVSKDIHEQFIVDQNNSEEMFLEKVESRSYLERFVYWSMYQCSRVMDRVF